MKTFLGMEVEQSGKKIKLHFDHDSNIKQVLGGFQGICQDDATPLDGTDIAQCDLDIVCPRVTRSAQTEIFSSKLKFAATWVLIDI